MMKKISSILLVLLLMLASFTAEAQRVYGDVNGDGVVNISDVNAVIGVILGDIIPKPPIDNHKWVDLGLPSGTLWATCNVGADNPEDYGDYFAWGETETKDVYDWITYKRCNGSYNTQTKYCTDSGYGTVDNKTELDPEDDAAYVNWGENWRIPTLDQLEELFDKCTWTWTTQNGVNGRLVTGPNGNTLFLPVAGNRYDSSLGSAGSYGSYWSRTLDSGYPYYADYLGFSSGRVDWGNGCSRFYGLTVRAVRVPINDHKWVDLGLPSGTLWATCNVGADNPEDYGDYFAWGETEPKDVYNWSTYKWCNGSSTTLTKYCTNSGNGTVDNKTELDPEDDAAYVNWGENWRMPTYEQQKELQTKCTWTWTTQNGVNGRLVTGPNGNTLFLPAAGDRDDSSLGGAGSWGGYWSRTLSGYGPASAYSVYFGSDDVFWYDDGRSDGLTVRPVRVPQN